MARKTTSRYLVSKADKKCLQVALRASSRYGVQAQPRHHSGQAKRDPESIDFLDSRCSLSPEVEGGKDMMAIWGTGNAFIPGQSLPPCRIKKMNEEKIIIF